MSASTSLWERVKKGSKQGFDATWKAADKLGAPVNKLSNKLGSEAFWPTTLDKESDKAARILKSFCKDGFYAEEERQPVDGPKQKQKVVKKIPAKVIQNAKGLAIFTTMRTGLWVSGAGGSGILVGRLPDGSWSPPSGILLHTAGLGFLVGVDIYDCVVVINTEKALEAFTQIRCTLGSEISVAAGPVGAGGVLETELHKRQAPVFTYMKSRGFYAGVQIDGTVIIERTDENERFYGERIPVKEILAGKVRHPPYEVKMLMETIKAAQGDTNVDESALPSEPPPGDYVVDNGHLFGVPEKDDPDPYGVLALEKEGLSLKEAGTHKRASWEEFSFNPSPTSPVHHLYTRDGQDKARSVSAQGTKHSSWRASAFADPKRPSSLRNSLELSKPTMTDTSTQTDFLPDPPSSTRSNSKSDASRKSSRSSFANGHTAYMQDVPEHKVLDTSPTRHEAKQSSEVNGYTTPPVTPPLAAVQEHPKTRAADNDDDEDAHIEESVVHSIQTVQPTSPKAISKARIVTVQKRVAPRLPPRNPNRSGPLVVDASPREASAGAEEEEETTSKSGLEPVTTEQSPDVTENSHKEESKVEAVKEKMEEVDLDEEDEDERPNPWAKMEETRKRASEESARMPGGFD